MRWRRKFPKLPLIQVVRVQPGDVLIAKTERPLTFEESDHVRRRLQEKLPGCTVFVMHGFDFTAVTPPQPPPVEPPQPCQPMSITGWLARNLEP